MMDPMTDTLGYDACLMRGRALLERSRYEDAAGWFRRGIEAEPDSGECYALLAICLMNVDGKAGEAQVVALRGVSIEPENCFNRCIHSLSLGNVAKDGQTSVLREALAEANEAARLDPESDLAQTTLGRAQLRLGMWPEAEVSARQALELDPKNTTATEILSASLLHQGKQGKHDDLVRFQLGNNPESDTAHSAAGWNALQKGDAQAANRHFMEALRLNPIHEGARLGLVESYRARSFFYRAILSFDAAINRITEGRQRAFWIGGYLIYRLAYSGLKASVPWAANLLASCWLLLVFWSSLSRGLSSLIMLFDRFARRSLKTKEKWEGILVGGMASLSLGLLVASFFAGKYSPALTLFAVGFFFSALPAASAFMNDHYIGKWLYRGIAAFCLGCTLYTLVALGLMVGVGINMDPGVRFILFAVQAAVVGSILRMFGLGYR
jgi:tetratricopeptide (TPR) repeat protein